MKNSLRLMGRWLGVLLIIGAFQFEFVVGSNVNPKPPMGIVVCIVVAVSYVGLLLAVPKSWWGSPLDSVSPDEGMAVAPAAHQDLRELYFFYLHPEMRPIFPDNGRGGAVGLDLILAPELTIPGAYPVSEIIMERWRFIEDPTICRNGRTGGRWEEDPPMIVSIDVVTDDSDGKKSALITMPPPERSGDAHFIFIVRDKPDSSFESDRSTATERIFNMEAIERKDGSISNMGRICEWIHGNRRSDRNIIVPAHADFFVYVVQQLMAKKKFWLNAISFFGGAGSGQ